VLGGCVQVAWSSYNNGVAIESNRLDKVELVAMQECDACGAEIPDGYEECPFCGCPINKEDEWKSDKQAGVDSEFEEL
jgi:rRNA maturation endonuclease Nob1